MAILQAVCRYALGKGEIAANPVKHVRKPTVKRSRAVVAVAPCQVEHLRSLFLEGYQEERVARRRHGAAGLARARPSFGDARVVARI